MTPHSYLSTPNLPSQRQGFNLERKDDRHQGFSQVQDEENTGSGFQPMTPHSYFSTPNLPSERSKERYGGHQTHPPLHEEDNTASGFQPMTPRSQLPSPNMSSHPQQGQHRRHQVHSQLQQEDNTASGFQPMTPHSYFSTQNLPSERRKERDGGHQTHPPLHEEDNTASGFQPMTPHSQLPSPNMSSHPQQGQHRRHQVHSQLQQEDNTASGFQPMTPHSYFSTPNLPSERHNERDSNHQTHSTLQEQEDTADEFQPMTPHSHVSAPNLPSQRLSRQVFDSNLKNSEHRTNSPVQDSNTHSGFQPMTPRSDMPSQSSENISSIENLRQQSSASTGNLRLHIPVSSISEGILQRLTPRSSSPKAIDTPSDLSSMSPKLRFNIKASNFINPDRDVEDFVVGDGSHMQQEVNVPIQQYLGNKSSKIARVVVKHRADSSNKKQNIPNSLRFLGSNTENLAVDKSALSQFQKVAKVCSSDAFVPHLSTAELAISKDASMSLLQTGSKGCSSEAFVPQLSAAELAVGEDAQTNESQNLKAAKVPSSDFFVPKLSPRDFPREPSRLQKGYFSCELTDCQENAYKGRKNYIDSTPSISSVTSSSCQSYGSSTDQGRLGRSVASSSKGGAGSLSPCNSETPCPSVDSPNPILEALKRKFASTLSSKTSSLCATPSLSQESLSDITVSKVTGQSTPMKTIEDIIQETGILDEPDLTLITTNLTIKPDSPERTRHFSEKSHAREGYLMTSAAVPNEINSVQTPTTASKTTPSYCESPSMMSFLQHEVSCFADSKTETSSNLILNTIQETLMNEDEFGRQQFTKNQPKKFEYKKRTERLWNNLEEVKTRKLEKEKKKQLVANRLKMKAYTKIYNKKTPEL